MEPKRSKTLTILGVLFLIYWFLDFWYNAAQTHDYSWLLWYSSAGFLLTGIALIIQNIKLVYSLFCALFVLESLWIIDLFFVVLSHQTLFGFTEYALAPSFQQADFYFTLYHALIPTGLLLAALYTRTTYKYGWVGATIFASTLALLTYFFASPTSQVNCLYPVTGCHTIFSFLYSLDAPYRILVALLSLTLFVFIPTNHILLYFKNRQIQHYSFSNIDKKLP